MSEVNIDVGLVKQEGGFFRIDEKFVEMLNGCICCMFCEDLLIEVEKLVKDGWFDYIVIELIGISELILVVQIFFYIDEEMGIDFIKFCQLDMMVIVVDVNCFWYDYQLGDSFLDCKEVLGEEDERDIVDFLID